MPSFTIADRMEFRLQPAFWFARYDGNIATSPSCDVEMRFEHHRSFRATSKNLHLRKAP